MRTDFRLALAAALLALCAAPAAAQGNAQTVPVFGATVLEVEIDAGGAAFSTVPTSAQSAVITLASSSGTQDSPQATLQWTRVGNRIVATIGRPGSGTSMLPFVPKTKMAYGISYPSNLKLVVHVFHGNVQVDAPVSAVQVTDSEGDVFVNDPAAPVAVDDANGSVTVRRARAGVDIASELGDVTADLAPGWLVRPIRMESADGNVRLSVPPSFRARVDASSDNGTVHDTLPRDWITAPRPPVWLYTEKGDVYLGPLEAQPGGV